MQRKQQVGECWVCVIFFLHAMLLGVLGKMCSFFAGASGNMSAFLPRFLSPRFLCPLLGSFSAHGFLPMVFYFG
jgi:hypothetical protein